MRNYDESDDPIREVGGRGIFSRLKSFENDFEYKVQKEMEEFERYLDEEKKRETSSFNNTSYSNNRNFSNPTYVNTSSNNAASTALSIFGIYFFCMICIIGFVIFNLFSTLSEDTSAKLVSESTSSYDSYIVESSEEENIYDDISASKLEFITFDNGTKMPTLYRFDKETKAYSCNFTEYDSRYKSMVNTLEIKYTSIPATSLEILEQSLIRRNYVYIGDDINGEVYVLSTEDGYIFAITSDTKIIYGCGNGSYKFVFDDISDTY